MLQEEDYENTALLNSIRPSLRLLVNRFRHAPPQSRNERIASTIRTVQQQKQQQSQILPQKNVTNGTSTKINTTVCPDMLVRAAAVIESSRMILSAGMKDHIHNQDHNIQTQKTFHNRFYDSVATTKLMPKKELDVNNSNTLKQIEQKNYSVAEAIISTAKTEQSNLNHANISSPIKNIEFNPREAVQVTNSFQKESSSTLHTNIQNEIKSNYLEYPKQEQLFLEDPKDTITRLRRRLQKLDMNGNLLNISNLQDITRGSNKYPLLPTVLSSIQYPPSSSLTISANFETESLVDLHCFALKKRNVQFSSPSTFKYDKVRNVACQATEYENLSSSTKSSHEIHINRMNEQEENSSNPCMCKHCTLNFVIPETQISNMEDHLSTTSNKPSNYEINFPTSFPPLVSIPPCSISLSI